MRGLSGSYKKTLMTSGDAHIKIAVPKKQVTQGGEKNTMFLESHAFTAGSCRGHSVLVENLLREVGIMPKDCGAEYAGKKEGAGGEGQALLEQRSTQRTGGGQILPVFYK